MYLTLTNLGPDPELLVAPGGAMLRVLHPHHPVDIRAAELAALVVGDRPDTRTQVQQQGDAQDSVLAALYRLIAGRHLHALRRLGRPADVRVAVANHGQRPLRVQVAEYEVELPPGSLRVFCGPGFFALHELAQPQPATEPAA